MVLIGEKKEVVYSTKQEEDLRHYQELFEAEFAEVENECRKNDEEDWKK